MDEAITRRLRVLDRPEWQMTLGERVALEGLVAQLEPRLAIEIGTAEGGSLERIAAHSAEVHAIDLSDALLADPPANATVHVGDSKLLLPELLAGFAAAGRNVDFALVDGDHTTEGVRADLLALLESPAVADSLILLHDSFNPLVRAGIESAGLERHPKVRAFDIDLLPGRVGRLGAFADQLLGGFAVVVIGAASRGLDLGLWSLDPGPRLTYDAHTGGARLARLLAGGSGGEGAPAAANTIPLDAEHIAEAHSQAASAGPPGDAATRGGRRLRALAQRVSGRRPRA